MSNMLLVCSRGQHDHLFFALEMPAHCTAQVYPPVKCTRAEKAANANNVGHRDGPIGLAYAT
jgi:hypothetical protein